MGVFLHEPKNLSADRLLDYGFFSPKTYGGKRSIFNSHDFLPHVLQPSCFIVLFSGYHTRYDRLEIIFQPTAQTGSFAPKFYFIMETVSGKNTDRMLFCAVLALLICIPPVWANADLPVYSTGFGGFTVIIVMPALILGEGFLLYFLSKDIRHELKKSIWSMSARANIISAVIGTFLLPFLVPLFRKIWAAIAPASDPVILMRQIFLAAYFVTVFIEALSYTSALTGNNWSLPVKKAWYWSLAVNSASYGIMAWLFVLGKLRHEDTSPFMWRIISRLHN